MAIQFQCVSCSQAIEVDDQWARRLVECPYCHDTVTVPGLSTIQSSGGSAPASLPSATPFGHPEAAYGLRPRPRNALAIWALVLAILGMGTLVTTTVYVAFQFRAIAGADVQPEELEELAPKIVEEAANRGEPWVVAMVLGVLGGLGMWVAGFICSIIAVTRQVRRGLAVVALVISLLPVVILLLV